MLTAIPLANWPPFIRTSDAGSFAKKTFQDRVPGILDRVLAENDFPETIQKNLQSLKAELSRPEPVIKLKNSTPDWARWNAALDDLPNQGWLDLPFHFAEAFFYRRLLEAAGYFEPGVLQGRDPFQKSKDIQIAKDIRHFERAVESRRPQDPGKRIEGLLYDCLWGNQVDLSMFSGDFTRQVGGEGGSGRMLIDQAHEISGIFQAGIDRLAYGLDNVGIELYFDLALMDFLLEAGLVKSVNVFAKNSPIFLSDAMPKDVTASILSLKQSAVEGARRVGSRLEKFVEDGRIRIDSDPLWIGYLTFPEAPARFYELLEGASLAIFKGDLNYRRLIGDRHWDPQTPTKDILDYVDIPVCALRTLKCEVVTGLSAGQASRLDRVDPDWMIDGEHAILQLIR